MMSQHIIPAIIPDSLEHLRMRLAEVKDVVSRVQIDVMDGTYARTKSWPYAGADRASFEAIRKEDQGLPYWQDFDFEIDLLVREPEKRVLEWTLAGAACLIVHVESTEKMDEILTVCFEHRVEVGIALKPSTPANALAPYIDRALFVQVMGNDRIGHHGVSLDERAVDRVCEVHARWPEATIGVDIGVNPETLPILLDAGATRFVAGSAVFASTSPRHAIAHLEDLVAEGVAAPKHIPNTP